MIPDSRHTASSPFLAPRGRAVAEAVRELLRARGFKLYRIAALSRARYPHEKAFHIRRNLYFQLRSGLSPTVQQVIALSQLTGSDFRDWLAAFGFSLGDIPRLQSALPRPRTGLIDSDLVNPQSQVPSFHYRRPRETLPAVAPLSQLLERSGSRTAASLVKQSRGDFVYAKIGTNDTLAFPELAPGSIVRADPRLVDSSLVTNASQHSPSLFLFEHSRGLNCGQLRIGRPGVALVISNPSFANIEFRLGAEIRILGVVDLELRFRQTLGNRTESSNGTVRIFPDPVNACKPAPIKTHTAQERSGALLKTARLRAGLSFRAASKLSHAIAKILGDQCYFASPGTLSDYETRDQPPRHIHKLFTLSVVYAVAFKDLLSSAGIAFNDDGKTTLSHQLDDPRTDFFESLRSRIGPLPLFLESALPSLAGLTHISLRDVFWMGGQPNQLHPSLRGTLFVLVNRRSKKPRRLLRLPLWDQPLYLLQQRDGSYLAASCAIERGRIMVYDFSQGMGEGQPVRRSIDAEVVGQVVGIARSLLTPR